MDSNHLPPRYQFAERPSIAVRESPRRIQSGLRVSTFVHGRLRSSGPGCCQTAVGPASGEEGNESLVFGDAAASGSEIRRPALLARSGAFVFISDAVIATDRQHYPLPDGVRSNAERVYGGYSEATPEFLNATSTGQYVNNRIRGRPSPFRTLATSVPCGPETHVAPSMVSAAWLRVLVRIRRTRGESVS